MSDNTSPLVTAAWSFAVLVVFLLLWEYGPGWVGMPEFVLPPLSRVAQEAVRIWQNERLMWHAGITALEVVIGFVLGSALGALIGYALGVSPRVEAILSPYLLALQIAPKVAFAPLFVMWLGYTIYPKILVAILIVFFPVLINVLSAMRAMDHDGHDGDTRLASNTDEPGALAEHDPIALPAVSVGLEITARIDEHLRSQRERP